jgi:cellulose synthase/poly-beta-1,6-N-acetylglucosamine synthase-like glycosyltransferase
MLQQKTTEAELEQPYRRAPQDNDRPFIGSDKSVGEHPVYADGPGIAQTTATIRTTVPVWVFLAPVLVAWCLLFAVAVDDGLATGPVRTSIEWWLAAILLHSPYALLVVFLASGVRERIGYFIHARHASPGGLLPAVLPKVCVQLPMFNEDAVARRIVEAAAALEWPRDRFEIQVLDDSTDPETRMMVERVCLELRQSTGIKIAFIHRTDRSGYKAGALEAGRHMTDAEFIAIFDADFLPPPDYLLRAVPHFYADSGAPLHDLALVQAQWGHLNDDQSPLTAAQALWVDDHHTLQQSWRSSVLGFVNFTGTAGIWRASALETVGGWSSSSLVEDCEISFRALFAGFRTKFVKEIVVPAELPQTIAAYRSQQKRWTQGWAQLQRLHLARLIFAYRTGFARKSGLVAMMCISWQWPLWFIWIAIFPFLLAEGLSLAAFGTNVALLAYLLPPIAFALFSAVAATIEARATYATAGGPMRISPARRFLRVFPYLAVNAGMLPHHFCAFFEGLFGPMHAEFERTPKTARVTLNGGATDDVPVAAIPKPTRRIARPAYIVADAAFVFVQLSWILAFAREGFLLATAASVWLVAGIAALRFGPAFASLAARLTDLLRKKEDATC